MSLSSSGQAPRFVKPLNALLDPAESLPSFSSLGLCFVPDLRTGPTYRHRDGLPRTKRPVGEMACPKVVASERENLLDGRNAHLGGGQS